LVSERIVLLKKIFEAVLGRVRDRLRFLDELP